MFGRIQRALERRLRLGRTERVVARARDRCLLDLTTEVIEQLASAVDVSKTGIQLSLDHWLSAGTVCDLRITTHTGRTMLRRARVIWTRREGKRTLPRPLYSPTGGAVPVLPLDVEDQRRF